jgi:predicted NBD/HSP70 family sugar kinase
MYGAVDIGGTKTLIAVFDKTGKIVEQSKFPTPKNYEEFGQELAANVAKLSTKNFQRAVVAIPGTPDRKRGRGIVFGNLPWTNVPIEEDVEKVLKCPVKIENDAKLAALSEAMQLRDEFQKVLYITVSTGIGGGLVINGKIDPHFHDIEPGQMILEHDGRFEQWEDFASGSALYAKYGKKASEITDTGTWYAIARNLAVGLNTLIATLDPDVIVIGGGVGSNLEKFQDRLVEQLKIYENPMTPVPPIRKAVHAEEAVIYGCYELAKARTPSSVTPRDKKR